MQDLEAKQDAHDIATLAVPARLKRVGREMRMLVDTADHRTIANASLLRIIARALAVTTNPTAEWIARQISDGDLSTVNRSRWN
jgi:hypothetical protein